MRHRELTGSPVDLVPGDHVCWAYESDEELVSTTRAWAVDGIAKGERLLYIAEQPPEVLRQRFSVLEDLDRLIDEGRVSLRDPSTMYGDGPVDDLGLLAYYAGATAEAVDDGCTGLRVAAEVHSLPDAAAVQAFVSWEQTADSFVNGAPMSALCAFDRRTVSDSAIAAVAAAHPTRHGHATSTAFVLHAHEDGFRLAGDVETFDRFRLDAMLRNATRDRDSVVLYLDDLQHASGGCAHVLHSLARRLADAGGQLVFKGAPDAFRDAWAVLGYSVDDVVFA